MTAQYGWIIDKDHLADRGEDTEAGTIGPSDIAPAIQTTLTTSSQGYEFKIFDDDDVLYYTGRALPAADEDLGSEEFAYGPLGDYGTPNAGATSITWTNHPEWDCG